MTATQRARQRHDALGRANVARRDRANTKRDLQTGRLSLAAVMRDPPPTLADVLLADIIRWTHGGRAQASLTRVGRLAVKDGVNLLLPLRSASAFSRAWVAEHGGFQWRPSS